ASLPSFTPPRAYWGSGSLLPEVFHLRPDRAGDQPRAALEREEVPCPVHHHDQPIPVSDEKIDVGEAPQQPSRKAADLEASDFRHCAPASDGRQHPVVAVSERRNGSSGGAGGDCVRHVSPLLLGNGSHARKRPALAVEAKCRIPYGENV